MNKLTVLFDLKDDDYICALWEGDGCVCTSHTVEIRMTEQCYNHILGQEMHLSIKMFLCTELCLRIEKSQFQLYLT